MKIFEIGKGGMYQKRLGTIVITYLGGGHRAMALLGKNQRQIRIKHLFL